MKQLLRALNSDLWETEDLAWLPDGEFPARVYGDFRFKGANDLSFYRVDGIEQTQIQRIVAALVCTAGEIRGQFSFRLLSEEEIIVAGFEISQTEGKTDDDAVNDLHVDMVKLTGKKLTELCYLIVAASETEKTFEIDDQLEFIARSRDNQFLKTIPKNIKPRLRGPEA